jgi:lipid-A-disaccharide synthase
MRRLVDHALCKLPFEEKWFRDRGVNATYVGHPFFDELRERRLDETFLAEQCAKPGRLVTILPGSRNQEVTANFPAFLRAAQLVRHRVSDARFAVAAYKPKHAEQCAALARQTGLPVEIHVGRTPELMAAAHSCLACSGSVSLELLYHTKPTVIHYRASVALSLIAKTLATVPFITLVNLLVCDDLAPKNPQPYDPDRPDADKALFPEYPTHRDRSVDLARHLVEWLSDDAKHELLVARLAALKQQIAHGGASQRASQYILRALGCPSEAPPATESDFAPRHAA